MSFNCIASAWIQFNLHKGQSTLSVPCWSSTRRTIIWLHSMETRFLSAGPCGTSCADVAYLLSSHTSIRSLGVRLPLFDGIFLLIHKLPAQMFNAVSVSSCRGMRFSLLMRENDSANLECYNKAVSVLTKTFDSSSSSGRLYAHRVWLRK
jgi:hypothetical protein